MAVRDDFAAGEVLAAADLNDTFASKVDYALPVNAQTGTTYTFVLADAEKLTTASNAAAVTLTIPPQSSVTWLDNTVLRVVNYGAGAVTVDGGSGVTVTNTATTISQYGAAVAIRTGSDAWTLVPFGGGDVPAATVSSPAATGQYTDTGITYDYYTFTSSGTLTVDTAGFADVLVIGGGGGGCAKNTANDGGGGGGAGGHLEITNAYLSAGSVTVTVGAGGAGGNSASNYGDGTQGVSSRIANYYGIGGAGARREDTGAGGGSGGGGQRNRAGGLGTPGQGNDGGLGVTTGGGGGGGANANGADGVSNTGGNGGAGLANSFTGSSVTRAGGGGGGASSTAGSGGAGGGGGGGTGGSAGTAGTANTGGGGGGGGNTSTTGAAGGSGIVIVRVKV